MPAHRSRIPAWTYAIALAFISIGASHASAQSPPPSDTSWKGPFFFIQMSDPQFGMYTANKDFVKETELYEKAIAAANQLKPAFVVITGDLINKAADPAQLAEFKRISAKLDPAIPLHLAPGNHDIENIPTAASLKFYRENVAKDYESFDVGGCHFIILNSTILLRPDLPDEMEKEMNWLKQDLESSAARKPRYSMLFMHHPFFSSSVEEPDSGNAIPKVRRKAMLDMLISGGVMHVFAGHLHRNAGGIYNGLAMTSTSSVGRPSGQDPNGFRIIKVREDQIEHEFVALEQVPQSVQP